MVEQKKSSPFPKGNGNGKKAEMIAAAGANMKKIMGNASKAADVKTDVKKPVVSAAPKANENKAVMIATAGANMKKVIGNASKVSNVKTATTITTAGEIGRASCRDRVLMSV